jgi:hypothetical protein
MLWHFLEGETIPEWKLMVRPENQREAHFKA